MPPRHKGPEVELHAAKQRIRELEHEVERLTRQVARERKHRARTGPSEPEDETISAPAPSVTSNACPKCSSEVLEFPNSYKTIRICSNKRCLWRTTVTK